MGVCSRTDFASRRHELVASGAVTRQDFYSAISNLLDDPAYDPGFDRLWDLRTIEFTTTAELKKIVDLIVRLRPSLGPARRIALVVGDDVMFGMMSMLAILVADERGQIQVFREMEGALAWFERRGGDEAL